MTVSERLQNTVADKYKLEQLLGAGGMGVVYSAVHRLTRQRVAIKFLREELCADALSMRRFIKEAQAAADLKHPNVVRLFDLDRHPDHGLYMVLELLDGESLAELLRREGRLSVSATCELLMPVMHALSFAHGQRIIHRDVNPSNVFLHREPGGVVPKLLDFGFARMLLSTSAALTRTDQIIGTPDHMSPEQAYGSRKLGPPTDVWSMAVVLYRCLTGVAPFMRDNVEHTMRDLSTGRYEPLDRRRPELPRAAELQRLIARALTVDASRRTPNMNALLTELAAAAKLDATQLLARHGLHWHPSAQAHPIAGAGASSPPAAAESPPSPVAKPPTVPNGRSPRISPRIWPLLALAIALGFLWWLAQLLPRSHWGQLLFGS